MGKFGTQGTGRGQLSSPTGIATDMYGFIIVVPMYQFLIKMASLYTALGHMVLVMVSSHGLLE